MTQPKDNTPMSADIAPDDTADRFSMIELDPLPTTAEPELPSWALTVIAAITAIVPVPPDAAFALLTRLVEPIRVRPDGVAKGKVREAMRAKLAEINAAERAGSVQPDTLAPREPIPTAMLSALADTQARIDRAGMPPDAVPLSSLMPEPVSARHATSPDGASYVAAPEAAPRGAFVADAPAGWQGRFRRIKSGRFSGEWGVLIGAAFDAVSRGDIVTATANNGRTDRFRIVEIVRGDQRECLCAVEAAPIGAPVRAEHIAAGSAPGAAPTERQAIPRVMEPGEMSREMPALVAPNPLGIETSVTMSRPAVRETVAPSAPDASTSQGVTHDHRQDGNEIGIFSRPANERRAVGTLAAPTLTATTSARDVRSLIDKAQIIAGAFAAGGPLQVSWTGRGKGSRVTLGKVRDALIEAGFDEDMAPGGVSAEANAGRAVESLKGIQYKTARVSAPNGVKARWQVGNTDTSITAKAGDPFGGIALIVDLLDDDTLKFDGDLALAARVRGHFATACSSELLRSQDMTPWLQRLLKRRYCAVVRVHNWYVPSAFEAEVRRLIAALEPLWGEFDEIVVTTGEDLCRSIGKGLTSEIADIETAYATKLDDARERARANVLKEHEREDAKRKATGRSAIARTPETIAAAQDAAAARATLTAATASSLLHDLIEAAARTVGYEAALGPTAVADGRARIAKLRALLEPLTDDTSLRAAMLELS